MINYDGYLSDRQWGILTVEQLAHCTCTHTYPWLAQYHLDTMPSPGMIIRKLVYIHVRMRADPHITPS